MSVALSGKSDDVPVHILMLDQYSNVDKKNKWLKR